MLFFELECLTSLCIPYTPRIALTPSKQTEWISSIIISKIGSAKYLHSTELPEAHLYWIPSSCISNFENAYLKIDSEAQSQI